jgi:hypothetical protein
VLLGGVKTAQEWETLLSTDFQATLMEIQKQYETQPNIPGENASLASLHAKVRTVLETATESINKIMLFISLRMPKMEDGNNFGVTVQLHVLKELKDTLEKLESKLDDLPNYFSKRADAVDKLGMPSTSTTDTKTNSSSDSNTTKTGGEKEGEEAEQKKSDSATQETKTTSTTQSAAQLWRQQHVVSIDVAHYASLKRSLTFAIHSFLVLLDNVEKNKAKLEKPRGSDGGKGAFSSMY